MSIERIGHIVYATDDMERSVAFYEGALGLRLKFRDTDTWAAFDGGGTTFAVEGTGEKIRSLKGGVVAFRVNDLDACEQRLVKVGHVPAPASSSASMKGSSELRIPAGTRSSSTSPWSVQRERRPSVQRARAQGSSSVRGEGCRSSTRSA